MKSPITLAFANNTRLAATGGSAGKRSLRSRLNGARRILMPVSVAERSLPERALEVLRRAGNPFRNYFARNPDDEVCARYHVAELFAKEREQLLGVVDLYRYEPTTHSEVV